MTDKKTDRDLKSSCHCGAITVIVPRPPTTINECQCTLCRRYAVAWAYYPVNEAQFELKEGAKVSQYVWGDKTLSFNFCGNCGCVCYWWPLDEQKPDGSPHNFGVNTRNMDPMEILHVNRKIGYSLLFEPLKDKAEAHEQDQAKYSTE